MKNKLLLVHFLLLTLVITSCNQVTKNEPIILTVNYPSYDLFYERIGYPFEQKYPHIKFQVIDEKYDPSKHFTTDIIVMNGLQQYKDIAAQNQLYSLSTLMLNDKKSFESLSKIVTSSMTLSDGEIYGLAPTFYGKGIFYNIDLFNQYYVPLPHNQMTWTELYELANQFPNEQADGSKLYGFLSSHMNNVPINLILDMGLTEGLSYIDAETYKLSINTPEWINIGETVLKAVKNNAVLAESEAGILSNVKYAMKIASNQEIINYELYVKPFQESSLWGVVTVPVNPLAPDYSNSYQFTQIYGINVLTQNKEAAWTFIKYLETDSDYYNYYLNVIWEYGIPANDLYRRNPIDIDLSALHALPPLHKNDNPFDFENYEIYNAFETEAQSIIDEYLSGLISIEECFAKIEKKGQLAVDSAILKLSNK